jgi:hypothetical protein
MVWSSRWDDRAGSAAELPPPPPTDPDVRS